MIRPRLLGWSMGTVLLLVWDAGAAATGDWPTHRHDIARSGVTGDELILPMSRKWVFRSPSPPAAGRGRVEPGQVWSYGVERLAKADCDATGRNRRCA